MASAYSRLMERVRDIGRLAAVEQLLEWDQETYMPKKGVQARSQQIALLAGLAHEQLVDDQTQSLLHDAEADADDYVAQTNIRETRRAVDRARRIPTELVKQIAQTSSLAKDAWAAARERSDFAAFAPHLTKLVDLKRRVADHVGYEEEPYDALLDEFEPGATASQIAPLFEELRVVTVALIQRIVDAPKKPDGSIIKRHYPTDRQAALSDKMAAAINYDVQAGRCDLTVHPFCTTIGGCGDVRITTRFDEHFLSAGLFGTLHETGHALYEQGLHEQHMFTPMGDSVSLGIHESQSRLWENMVGRSKAFWQYHYADLQKLFAESLADVSLDAFYGAINAVTPSLIRVEADELTYNLHIILRFEMERELLAGRIDVKDIPQLWNKKMTESVGITPPDDRDGCLQDIHWSMGAFGYFPTYTLGNLYAAQFFEQASKDIPKLHDHIAGNDHLPLLHWLRTNIHEHGRRFRAGELVERVTGKPLTIQPFKKYVTQKFSQIYGF